VTSTSPIKWKGSGSRSNSIGQVSHIDDVEHRTSPVQRATGATIVDIDADANEPEEEIRPAAFTIQLGAKNSASRIQTVSGPAKRPPLRIQQPALSDPSTPTPREAVPEAPSLPEDEVQFSAPAQQKLRQAIQLSDDPPAQQKLRRAIQLSDDPPELIEEGPPEPASDPDDAAPLPPATLQQRATPQNYIQQEKPELRDPADVVMPPVKGKKKKSRCNSPNDRDCCADEQACVDKLAQLIVMDKLILHDKTQLDISPQYAPNEKPDEHERNEERKAQQMTLAGKREWQDKNGAPLGSGILVNLARGRAVIRTDSGEIEELKLRSLSDDDLCFIAAWYNLPTECTLGNEQFQQRQFAASSMTWKASALCHKTLYFEDVQLERYGHTAGPFVQPVLSGAHFFANVALLPYKLGINPPRECHYALGYYRPGDCAPWMVQPFPLSARGAMTALGIYTAGTFIIP
jgi:hypothetical protein